MINSFENEGEHSHHLYLKDVSLIVAPYDWLIGMELRIDRFEKPGRSKLLLKLMVEMGCG
jgi:hypothetical protein